MKRLPQASTVKETARPPTPVHCPHPFFGKRSAQARIAEPGRRRQRWKLKGRDAIGDSMRSTTAHPALLLGWVAPMAFNTPTKKESPCFNAKGSMNWVSFCKP